MYLPSYALPRVIFFVIILKGKWYFVSSSYMFFQFLGKKTLLKIWLSRR